ncbi:MAG: endonuclease/exonuclease/phosphatase family protein [Planctomycetota bacterium]
MLYRNRLGCLGLVGLVLFALGSDGCGAAPAEPALRIHDIQGKSHLSPKLEANVSDVPGVVTSLEGRGFQMQDPKPDEDPATSEAIRVFLGRKPNVKVGDDVRVAGVVREHYPGGRKTGNLSITEISATDVRVVASGQKLPTPIDLASPGRSRPHRIICDDAPRGDAEKSPFDPENDGLDYLESLEGMLVKLDECVVIGPTNKHGEVWVGTPSRKEPNVWSPRGSLLRGAKDANPERIQIQFPGRKATPSVDVGHRLRNIVGIVNYSFGCYEVRLLRPAIADPRPSDPKPLEPETTDLKGDDDHLTIGSYNVENLHPGATTKLRNIGQQIADLMKSPDVISVQEVQDGNGPKNDELVDGEPTFRALVAAIREAGGPTYAFRQIDPVDDADGGQPGGNIRVGLLYRPERVRFITTPTEGRPKSPSLIGIDHPSFERSRKSLFCELEFRGHRFGVIGNHLTSKYGSPPDFGRRQPRPDAGLAKRNEQAAILRDYCRGLAKSGLEHIVVLGDFNDSQWASPLTRLTTAFSGGWKLHNLTTTLAPNDCYTYIFQGNAGLLDHVLVTAALVKDAKIDAVHVNCEFSGAPSDHDPLIVRLKFPSAKDNEPVRP